MNINTIKEHISGLAQTLENEIAEEMSRGEIDADKYRDACSLHQSLVYLDKIVNNYEIECPITKP